LLVSLIERYQVGHDQPVWEVVREPKYKPIYSQMNVTTYDPEVELPYTVTEIAKRIDRKESSVLRSLKRLEKRSKVKDVHGGWKRA
jgi:DNA-binding MarR family transcriptional regulator